MWAWLWRKLQEHRAARYLATYGDDSTAVRYVLSALCVRPTSSARDAAEAFRGCKLSDAEWARIAWRWERVWTAIVCPQRASPHANAAARTSHVSVRPFGRMQQIAPDFIRNGAAAGRTFT